MTLRTALAIGLATALLVSCSASPSRLKGEETVTLKVLTLNAYLLAADPNGSTTLAQRLERLPAAIAATGADVVILQEVWGQANRSALALGMQAQGYAGQGKETPSFWPPYYYGNGLYVFARAPLAFVGTPQAWVYPAGSLLNFDTFTNKGVLRARVQVPGAGLVDVFAAHTSFLPFSAETHDFDLASEPKLLQQVATIKAALATATAPVKILGVDTNTHPQRWSPASAAFGTEASGVYAALTQDAGLKDAMASAPEIPCLPTCSTWDNDRNGFIKQGLFNGVPGVTTDPNERIDFVLYAGDGVKATRAELALEAEHDLTVPVEGGANIMKKLPLSDHFGVLATLEIPAQ